MLKTILDWVMPPFEERIKKFPRLVCADRGWHPWQELPYGTLAQYDDWTPGGPSFWKDEQCSECGDTRRVRRDWTHGYAPESV